MRRRYLTVIAVAMLAAVLALTVGCGSKKKSSSSGSSSQGTTLSAADIVSQGEAATAKAGSGSFTADLSVLLKVDAAKMTNPTQAKLASQPVKLHVDGKTADKPMALDVALSVSAGGQNIAMGLKAANQKAWVGFQGKWYVLPPKDAQSLLKPSANSQAGQTPTQQLQALGIDRAAWASTYTVVGTENLNGVDVYHVKATVDPNKVAASIIKALQSPKLLQQLGQSNPTTAQQIQQLETQNAAQIKSLESALKSVSVDYWYGKSDLYLRKVVLTAGMSFTGKIAAQGLQGATVSLTANLSDFNKPVTVAAPANALPFAQLQSALGALVGSAAGTGTGTGL
jgi:hypothetical protein